MKISAKRNVQLFVKQCIDEGLKHVVVSPGSRNAPLTVSFNQHPKISCTIIPDERSAAFFALGMAQELNEPVALLCTSGSASTNYYPAIVEAYYQRIPLVAITADRPQNMINQGDGQSIVQADLYKNHIDYFCQFNDVESTKAYETYLLKETRQAFAHLKANSKGPVHINFSLSEPLYDTVEIDFNETDHEVPKHVSKKLLTAEQIDSLRAKWGEHKKIMILCGQMIPNQALKDQLKLLADKHSALVLVENTSNLVDQSFIHCIDRTLNSIPENEQKDFAPDLLITLGGAIVSKRIKSFLRTHQAKQHWKVSYDFPEMDTYQNLSQSFEVDAVSFFRQLKLDDIELNSDYGRKWKQKDLLIQDKANSFFESLNTWGDIYAFHMVLDCIPENSILHLANSSVVRYAQLFDPIRSIIYRSNRGVSGIDGSTSTAAGASYIAKETWVNLITGDMSFFYDSNAFWNHELASNFRIFLINNGGGGIFKIIPGPDSTEELDDFFVFQNTFDAKHICSAFGISHYSARSVQEIEEQMEDFYTYEKQGKPKLMEILTSNQKNEVELDAFFKKIRLAD